MQLRGRFAPLHLDRFLTGKPEADGGLPDVAWWRADGRPMQTEDWANEDVLALTLTAMPQDGLRFERVFIAFNRSSERRTLTPPEPRPGLVWSLAVDSANSFARLDGQLYSFTGEADARSVTVLIESAG
jgi:pullulanase/glycogen debranching enzyme